MAIRGCRVDCIAPVAVRGEPNIKSLVPAPDGDQSMGSCEFSTNRAALPKATAPAPAIPTLIPVANSCDVCDVARSNDGAVGVNPHDLSRSKISASDAFKKRLVKRILSGRGYGWVRDGAGDGEHAAEHGNPANQGKNEGYCGLRVADGGRTVIGTNWTRRDYMTGHAQ